MKMKKKGIDISVNIIIVAALALIVLVIMVLIFTGRMSIFGKELTKETAKQPCPATHEARAAADCPAIDTLIGNYDVASGQVCCKKP